MTFRRQFWMGMALAAGLLLAAYLSVLALEVWVEPADATRHPLVTLAGTFAFLGLLSFGNSIMRGFARLVFVQNGELPSSLFERLDYPLWHWWLHIDTNGKDRDA